MKTDLDQLIIDCRAALSQFPPFGQDHLDNSLQHLSDLVAGH